MPDGPPLNPVPLPAEVAMDEAPLTDHIIELIMAGVVKPATDTTPLEPPPGMDAEARKRWEKAVASATETVQRWEIEDEAGAEWAGGHFTRMVNEIDAQEREMKEFTRRLTTWHEAKMAPLLRFKALLEAKLLEYGRARREASDNKIKTVSVPSATISSRGGGKGSYEIEDEAALIAWLEKKVTDPDKLARVIRMKKSVLKSDLTNVLAVDKDHALFDEDSGEKAPGIAYKPAPTTYKVDPR